MVRVVDRHFQPSINATFGEDGSVPAKSFVPKLGRLGSIWYPENFVEKPGTEGENTFGTESNYVTPAPPVTSPAPPPAKSWLTPNVMLGGGIALLAVGIGAYIWARSR